MKSNSNNKIAELAIKMINEPIPIKERDLVFTNQEEINLPACERIILALEREAAKGNVSAAKELREYMKLK